MADGPLPTVTAMLVCDQIIPEQGTNKKSLIGIFEVMNAFAFPAIVPRIAVYVRLLDGFGKYPVRLRLVHLKDESLVADINLEMDITDEQHAWEVVINLMGVILPEPGKYEFQFYARDVYLHRVTMEVAQQGGMPWQPQQQQRQP